MYKVILKNFKKFLLVFLMVFAVAFVAACGDKTPEPEPEAA